MEADSNNNNITDLEADNNITDVEADTCDDSNFNPRDVIIFDTSADCHDTSITSAIMDPAPLTNDSSESFSTKLRLRSDPPLSKHTRTNPVWKYFQHFDVIFHPDKRHH